MRNRAVVGWVLVVSIVLAIVVGLRWAGHLGGGGIPRAITEVLAKPTYRNATWGLRVVDLETGEVVHELRPEHDFLIGAVRQLFSIGVALDQLGADHRFETPVYRVGTVDESGVLTGDLILVASGDLTMGGRTNPDGTIAITDFDHNEADALGNAELTAPDPLAGYDQLARQVAASGIKSITGDVVIDDRLFVPFQFRGEFDVRPIFVNDDVIDVIIRPTAAGAPASVAWRPISAAFDVVSSLATEPASEPADVKLDPELPACLGQTGCTGQVSGTVPVEYEPPLTNKLPLVQTFRIVEPSSYARTVFIEALRRAGVLVEAEPVAPNPIDKLLPRNAYAADARVAQLVSLPYSDYAKLILKVSYDIGADTSLVLFGLTQGVDDMQEALTAERSVLTTKLGIDGKDFSFVDGSGGGFTTAKGAAITRLLAKMTESPTFPAYRAALPVLASDGSLGLVDQFASDPTLAGAKGNVRATTGTFVQGTESGALFKAQALAGYVDTKSGRRLAFTMAVNDVGAVTSLDEVRQVLQDQGRIAAILWRDG